MGIKIILFIIGIFMKVIISLFVAFQLLFALDLTQEEKAFLEQHPVIKVSNEPNWPPFDYNENGQAKGYSIDYLKLLASKLNVEFKFITNKWPSLVQAIERKEIDVIHPLGKNSARERFLHFTSAHIDVNYAIITRVETSKIQTLKDLEYKTVAVVDSWNSTRLLKKLYPKIIFRSYNSAKEKLEAVAYGEVDATIEGYFTANYVMQRYLLSNLKITAKVKDEAFSKQLYIAVRKDWKLFHTILQKAMNSVSEEEMLALNIKWIKVQDKARKDIALSVEELNYLSAKKRITMCIDPDWMPYEKNLNNKHVGMSADYFELFKKLIPIDIEYIPTQTWTQTLEYAKNRECDIISLALKTPLRSEYMNFTSPYLRLPLVIATNINEPFVSDVNDILDKKIAVVKGHAYIEILKIRYPKIQLVEVDSLDVGFKKVLDGEIYGFLDSLASIGYDIQRHYVGNIKIAGKLDVDLKIGIATRNDEPLLHTIFEKAVRFIQPDEHREILNKWVSVKFDKTVGKEFVVELSLFVLIVALFLAYRQYLLKQQNTLLKESNEEFEQLINSTIEALFILEHDQYIEVNHEAVKLFGARSKKDLIGLRPFDLIHESDHDILRQKLEQNAAEPYEVRAVKRDGTIFPVLIKAQTFMFKNKKVRVAAIVDLSELKNKEKMLLEQTKMAALGEMLGNIAHQWRQPLSVISTAASGMKVKKSYGMLDDTQFEEYNEAIMQNVEYLSNTIDDFKNFIKAKKEPHEFVLHEHLQKDLSIVHPILKNNNIEVITDIDTSIVMYNIENELTQAFINIITNAKDAFLDKKEQRRLIFISAHKYNQKVVISIKDNAGGIDEEIINRIFEPYFTTKHQSQGTGLGLFMSRQIIVESMHGTIDVANESFDYEGINYKGAHFRLTL